MRALEGIDNPVTAIEFETRRISRRRTILSFAPQTDETTGTKFPVIISIMGYAFSWAGTRKSDACGAADLFFQGSRQATQTSTMNFELST